MRWEDDPSAEGQGAPDFGGGGLLGLANREQHLLPIKFAKEHIVKIEADMQKMKQRFVKLMREMDQNSKLIEEETKEYYVEFLKKWREVAKQRILMHRKNTEALSREKEQLDFEYKTKLDDLNQ